MANGKTSGLMLCSNSIEQSRKASDGPIAILWDIKNCPVPSDILPEDVAGNITTALQVHPTINGAVNMFSAYGDSHSFSRRLREGCQRTGVKLIDVPCGKKGSVDMAILVDIFLFALDNPPPSSIMLITDDVDFSSALHVLGQRGYTVILAIPSGPFVSSALSSAGSYVWDWFSLARGLGSVPPTKTPEEEAVVCREISAASHSSNEDYLMCRQPGDLPRLKGQLVKLLKTLGGCLSTSILHTQYEKSFGRPLFVSDYGTSKLGNLMKKMRDVISMEGQGRDRVILLKEHSTNTNKEQKTEVVCTQNKRKREEQEEEEEAAPRYNFRRRVSKCTTFEREGHKVQPPVSQQEAPEGHNVQLPVSERKASESHNVQLPVSERKASESHNVQLPVSERKASESHNVQLPVSEQQASESHNVQLPVSEQQASESHNVQLPVSEQQASESHNVQLPVSEQQALNKCL